MGKHIFRGLRALPKQIHEDPDGPSVWTECDIVLDIDNINGYRDSMLEVDGFGECNVTWVHHHWGVDFLFYPFKEFHKKYQLLTNQRIPKF
jgi:hypothetical protein